MRKLTAQEVQSSTTTQPAKFIDEDYGEFKTVPKSIFNGMCMGHPKRGSASKNSKRITPIEDIISRLKTENPKVIIVPSTYVSCGEPALFVDADYGEFETLPKIAIRGHRHPEHRHRKPARLEYCLAELAKIKGHEITLDHSSYVGMRVPINFTIDGVPRRCTPAWLVWSLLTSKKGRPRSSRNKKLSLTEVKNNLPDKYLIDDNTFKSCSEKAKFNTPYGEWWVAPSQIFRGANAPGKRGNKPKTIEEIKKCLPPRAVFVLVPACPL